MNTSEYLRGTADNISTLLGVENLENSDALLHADDHWPAGDARCLQWAAASANF